MDDKFDGEALNVGNANGLPARVKHNASWSPATRAVHADDPLNDSTDVAPSMHVATTFRYPHDPEELKPTGSYEVS